jgi:hypothetical protein
MEAFKGDALANIVSATEIISDFPEQVIVLKSTSIISQLKGRRCGFTRRMIDKGQTRGFPEWCQGLARAKGGDKDLQRQILENGKEADEHLNRMRNDQKTFADNLEAASKEYTEVELKTLRAHKPITPDMFDKIGKNILNLAAFLFALSPNFVGLPHALELPYTFIFRYAVTGYLVALRWLSVGGAKNVKPEKIRNDMVDATLAAYATYFQDLLSNDVKAKEIYDDAKFFIKVFIAVPPPPDHILARLGAKRAELNP